jgi:hypothetical protein
MRILFSLLLLSVPCLPMRGESFAAWAAGHGLSGDDAAPDADPDYDRMSNLLEYMLDGGDPTVSGPLSILPQQGWSQKRSDGDLQEWTATHENGPRDVHYMALKYKLRADTEGYKAMPEVSWSPMSSQNGGDSGLIRYYSGRAAVRVDEISGGYVQATSLFCDKLWQRGFMRLRIVPGTAADPGPQLPTGLAFGPLTMVNRVVGSNSTVNTTDRDVKFTAVTSPTVVTDVSWPWALSNSGYSSGDVTRSSSDAGIIGPTGGNTALWTFVTPGTATLSVITPGYTYSRAVTITSSTSVLSRTQTFPSVTSSLRAHLETQTDTRANSYAAITERALVYADTTPGVVYERNANCWLSGVDLTPVSVWSDAATGVATLVSPRHFIAAAHYGFSTGDVIHWVKADDTLVSGTVADVANISGTDIQVGVLTGDVGAGIDFCRVLPDAWAVKLPTLATYGVPGVIIHSGRAAYTRDLPPLGSYISATAPTAPAVRVSNYMPAVGGDSGSPMGLLISDKLVLVCCLYGGGAGSGPGVQANRAAINAAMTTLGGGYSLTDVDLSSYTTF